MHLSYSIAIALVLAGPFGAQASFVRIDGDRLTIAVDGVPLRDVLRDVSRASGAAVRGEPEDAERLVTLDVDRQPIEDVLGRVLGTQSFSLRYTRGTLTTIVLVGHGTPGDVSRAPRGLEQPIAFQGALAVALAASEASFERVMDVAVRGEDSELRKEATAAALASLESDPGLRAEFLANYATVAPAVAAAMLARTAGGRDFVRHLATHATSSDLRVRAEAIAAALRDAPLQ